MPHGGLLGRQRLRRHNLCLKNPAVLVQATREGLPEILYQPEPVAIREQHQELAQRTLQTKARSQSPDELPLHLCWNGRIRECALKLLVAAQQRRQTVEVRRHLVEQVLLERHIKERLRVSGSLCRQRVAANTRLYHELCGRGPRHWCRQLPVMCS